MIYGIYFHIHQGGVISESSNTVTDRIIENNKWEKRTGSARPFACGKNKNKSGL